ncbi:hypothetical protein [Accumulibacter sp.]|uniref:hypothetical protein n=1 Tax=Accumulibacter sp. TaxID=2053492 RepID=UPI0004B2C6FD|nr:hypothetical protein [Accumulibacter sp.]HRF06883.1 hypothetical protein [Accumulibacter sp.]
MANLLSGANWNIASCDRLFLETSNISCNASLIFGGKIRGEGQALSRICADDPWRNLFPTKSPATRKRQ